MGMDLDLYVEDDSISSPFLTSSFTDEIVFEWYIKFTDFLNNEEQQIITPNTYGEIVIGKKRAATFSEKAKIPWILRKATKGEISVEEINKLRDQLVHRSEKVEDRERNPSLLKAVLKKVENHLILHKNHLPLVHTIYETKARKEEIDSVVINDVKANLEGDLFFYDNYSDIRDKILVKSYLEDFGKIEQYITVQPEIQINHKTYFTKTITKAEQFEGEFKKCYEFLEEAIQNNKKVLWEFG